MFWKKKPAPKTEPMTVPVGPDERRSILKELTGSATFVCDLCSGKVTQGNLAGWDEDGHVYCDGHGRGIVEFRTGDVYHARPTSPEPGE